MKHKQKIKLARKLISSKEALFKVSIFNSANWRIRALMRRAKEVIKCKNADPERVEAFRKILKRS